MMTVVMMMMMMLLLLMMMMMVMKMMMMMQGNACQLYPKVISFYSEPPHAIAWPEITINFANNTNMVFGLLWSG